MNPLLLNSMTRIGLVITELAIGFGIFWLGQLAYQKLLSDAENFLRLKLRR